MKRIISIMLMFVMICSLSFPVMAQEVEDSRQIKTIEVSMANLLTKNSQATKLLEKDSGRLFNQTGIVQSTGQYVDFTKVLPTDAKVVSVTIYCPTSVKVSKGKFTSIDSFIIRNGAKTASVKFLKTNSPTSTSKTIVLAGERASIKWLVQIQGKVLSNYTGMDGFTVYGGCKMIIEYQ
jgi:hypothetical protein